MAQQLGSSIGITVIVAYASMAAPSADGAILMAERVALAMQAATAMLILVILIVIVLLVRSAKVRNAAATAERL